MQLAMTPMLAQNLLALSNVGRGPVRVRIGTVLLSESELRVIAEVFSSSLTIDGDGFLLVHQAGSEAWDAFHAFSRAVLAATVSRV